MTRNDTAVVGVLILLLAIIAGMVGIPALQATTASASPTATPTETVDVGPYREGVLGHVGSISPLTARTQVDRDLVALIFSGLVRNGPDGALVPDLAAHWSVDASGRVWTFDLQPDATWHDGEPVTADDVVYTIDVLQGPGLHRPGRHVLERGHGRGHLAQAGHVHPRDAARGLPAGGDAADRAGPPAGRHPGRPAARRPFGQSADRGRSVRASTPSTSTMPSSSRRPISSARTRAPTRRRSPTDSLSTPAAEPAPGSPDPVSAGMEFRFFDDAETLAQAYRDGELDGASRACRPTSHASSRRRTAAGSPAIPASTLTTVLLNQRPGHPEFRDPAVRTALLAAIDREGIVRDVWSSLARSRRRTRSRRARGCSTRPPIRRSPYSTADAETALKEAGWTKKDDGWYLPAAKSR